MDEGGKRLTCGAEGEPMPDFAWYFNGEPVSKSHPTLTSFVRTTSFLEFPKVSNIDDGEKYAGIYECRANNSLGNITHAINVQVKGRT